MNRLYEHETHFPSNIISENVKFQSNEQTISTLRFNKLQKTAISIALINAVDQLRTLELLLGLPKIEVNLDYQTLDEKYACTIRNKLSDVGGNSSYNRFKNKAQKDRSFVEKIICEMIKEIGKYSKVEILKRRVEEFWQSLEDENSLIVEAEREQKIVRDMLHEISTRRKNMKEMCQKKADELGRIKDHFEDIKYECAIKLNYIEQWENSKMVLNDNKIFNAEKYYRNLIDEGRKMCDDEERINTEMKAYLEMMIAKYKTDMERWIENYNNEIEERDLKIKVLKDTLAKHTSCLEEMKIMYNKRKNDIEECKTFKEYRRVAAMELEKNTKAATKIQAWWRGMMYRKCLGPYRKKKMKASISSKKEKCATSESGNKKKRKSNRS